MSATLLSVHVLCREKAFRFLSRSLALLSLWIALTNLHSVCQQLLRCVSVLSLVCVSLSLTTSLQARYHSSAHHSSRFRAPGITLLHITHHPSARQPSRSCATTTTDLQPRRLLFVTLHAEARSQLRRTRSEPALRPHSLIGRRLRCRRVSTPSRTLANHSPPHNHNPIITRSRTYLDGPCNPCPHAADLQTQFSCRHQHNRQR